MRRKSTRNTKNSSPEKPKPEPPKKSRRLSRRRKRSSSRSSEASDETQPATKESVQTPVEDSTPAKAKPNDMEKPIEPIITGDNGEKLEVEGQSSDKEQETTRTPTKENDKEAEEPNEETEEMDVKKTKGKSKGRNKSNIDQSRSILEPEIENENVQGTPQSPSNDKADSENVIQNVNDTAKCEVEAQEGDKIEEKVSEIENVQDTNFDSEYAQSNKTLQDIETPDESANVAKTIQQIDTTDKIDDERTSEAASEENATSNIGESDKATKEPVDKPESSFSKKKITLRRSPLSKTNEETSMDSAGPKTRRSMSAEENTQPEDKGRKKITLKRRTTEELSSSDAQIENRSETSSRDLPEDGAENKRKLSNAAETTEPTIEDVNKKATRRIKLIRNFSRDTPAKTGGKTMKWGRSDWLNQLTSSFYKVDIDSIKIVCPTLEFLAENEVDLELVPKERRKSEGDFKRTKSMDSKTGDDRPSYEKQSSEEPSGEAKNESNTSIIAMNRKISIVDDTASKLRPPPSPPSNPPSEVLFITNLVRPFTVKQLKELLERTGKIKEEGFWTDRIKSKCYVRYESIEEAEATRNALHGVHWPIGNGKKLVIDFATVEDLEKAKNPAPPVPAVVPEKLPSEKENREPERGGHDFKDKTEERKIRDVSVREWDLGKDESHRRLSRSRSRSRERIRKHSRRSYTPDDYVNSKRQRKTTDDAVPQKLMDDLFLKTKATPSIYWQPLTPEEIVTKQQQRLVRMEEHKRRIEETRGRIREARRPPFRRR